MRWCGTTSSRCCPIPISSGASSTGGWPSFARSHPASAQRSRLERELARTTAAMNRLVHAYQEDLLSLDELRSRMPDLPKKESAMRAELDALDAQLVDQETYLKLAENL
jgi:site-specific DNA recombinase